MAEMTTSLDHMEQLEAGYRRVGDVTWGSEDFSIEKLAASRQLFTDDSLQARRPVPRALEVVALVAGLPFPAEFVASVTQVQAEITAVLGDKLHYWVAPQNLGVEFCVFKWPEEPWDESQHELVRGTLAALRQPLFRYEIRGIQVNPDGCVVAKGFDSGRVIFQTRAYVRDNVPFLPRRQSEWAHVPLGRILEPIGARRFAGLRGLIERLRSAPISATTIASVKLVHETRWYMEARTILAEYALAED